MTDNPSNLGNFVTADSRLHFTLRTARLHTPPHGMFDAGLRHRPFPDDTASLLPGLLTATRTGLWTSPGFPETFLCGTDSLELEGSRLGVMLLLPGSFVLVG